LRSGNSSSSAKPIACAASDSIPSRSLSIAVVRRIRADEAYSSPLRRSDDARFARLVHVSAAVERGAVDGERQRHRRVDRLCAVEFSQPARVAEV
jgi:hypothetical protein